jgi:hypothetical protein
MQADALRCSGARVKQSSQAHAAVTSAEADLVVLSDNLVADPRMLRDVHGNRFAHLAVRVRDGTGLVGPLVIPGVTSCLGRQYRALTHPARRQRVCSSSHIDTGPWSRIRQCGAGCGA